MSRATPYDTETLLPNRKKMPKSRSERDETGNFHWQRLKRTQPKNILFFNSLFFLFVCAAVTSVLMTIENVHASAKNSNLYACIFIVG